MKFGDLAKKSSDSRSPIPTLLTLWSRFWNRETVGKTAKVSRRSYESVPGSLLNSGSSTRLYGMRLTAALCNGAVRGQPVNSHVIICHTSVTCERHSHVCIYTT